MKWGILFLLLAGSFSAQSQTLKELLYSGKLKNDSNTVIRKTDDLNSKIDTSQKKMAAPAQTKMAPLPADSLKKTDSQMQSVSTTVTDVNTDSVRNDPVTTTTAVASNIPVKTNTKIWKLYTDSLTRSLQADVLSSKKIKKDTYFFLVEYELNPDGKVDILNVTVTPENPLLASHAKQWMETTPPQLNAASDPSQKKLKRKQSFTVTKE